MNGNIAKRFCKGGISNISEKSPKCSLGKSDLNDDDFDDDLIKECELLENKCNEESKKNLITGASNSLKTGEILTKRKSDFPDFSDLIPPTKAFLTNPIKANVNFSNIRDKKHSSPVVFTKVNSFPSRTSMTTPSLTPCSSVSKITENNIMGKDKEIVKKISKLEEELLIKQGEASNLRCELKRKDNLLEAERLQKRLIFEAAEKKEKDKNNKALIDLQAKQLKLERDLEKAESNLLFKNREIEELLSKQKSNFNIIRSSQVVSSTRIPFSQGPKNFADNFDFAQSKVKMKDFTQQTHNPQERCHKNLFLNPKRSSNEMRLPQQYIFLNKLSNRKAKVNIEVTKQVSLSTISLACQSLKEIREKISNNEKESLMIENEPLVTWYYKKIQPHIQLLSRLKTNGRVLNYEEGIIELLKHIEHGIWFKEPNIELKQFQIITALTNIINDSSSISNTASINILMMLKSIINQINTQHLVISVLPLIIAMASRQEISAKICSNNDNCLLKYFFKRLDDVGEYNGILTVSKLLIKLASQLLRDPPIWLRNVDCNCPFVLFKKIALHLYEVRKCLSENSELWPVLFSYVRLLNAWQIHNSSWAAHAISYPASSVLLNKLWEKISQSSECSDRSTIELLRMLDCPEEQNNMLTP